MENIHHNFTVPFEMSKMVSFASSIMKKNVVFPSWSRFSVKSIRGMAFASASSSCCLLKSIAVTL